VKLMKVLEKRQESEKRNLIRGFEFNQQIWG